MISFVQNPKALKVYDYGDILYPFKNWDSTSTGDQWFSGIEAETRKCIALSSYGMNTWDILEKELGFEVQPFKKNLEYQCPFTKYTHYWGVPVGLLFTNSEREIAFLAERSPNARELPPVYRVAISELKRNKVVDVLMGSGYTDYTRPCDGSGAVHKSLVKTSDPDLDVVFMTWVWYNK